MQQSAGGQITAGTCRIEELRSI